MDSMTYFNSATISASIEASLQAIRPDLQGLKKTSSDCSDVWYMSEHRLEDMFLVDFYVPEARLVFEVNGMDHFYPYTYKKNNVTNFKSKLLREWGQSSDADRNYKLINLNV